jgi:large subunit ribosomal protein L30
VTWGEVSLENIVLLLRKRGRVVGNRKLTDEYVKEIGYESLENLAEAIHMGKVEFCGLLKVKPVFRLHPPKKGFRGKVKRSFAAGGVTGYRGEAINDLIERMV